MPYLGCLVCRWQSRPQRTTEQQLASELERCCELPSALGMPYAYKLDTMTGFRRLLSALTTKPQYPQSSVRSTVVCVRFGVHWLILLCKQTVHVRCGPVDTSCGRTVFPHNDSTQARTVTCVRRSEDETTY